MEKNIIWTFDNLELEKRMTGPVNQTLDLINTELGVCINHIPNHFILESSDDSVLIIKTLMNIVSKLANNGIDFSDRDLVHIIQILKSCDNLDKKEDEIVEFYKKKILILHTAEGKRIYAKTLMQKRYLELLESSSILFVTGSAGTLLN